MNHAAFPRFLSCTLLLAILLFGTSIISAQTEVVISLPSLNIPVGDSTLVEAAIDCGETQCGLFAITLNFDPAVLRVSGVEFGDYLGDPRRGQVLIAEQAFDNSSGIVRLAAASMGTAQTSSQGVLFRLNLTGRAEGMTAFSVSRLEIGDVTGANMTGAFMGGEVSVEDVSVQNAPEAETPVATVTLNPTLISSAPATPTLQATEALPPTNTPVPQPCMISTSGRNVAIHVGPDANRSVRGSLPRNQSHLVTGQAQSADGSRWWRIEPLGGSVETDRFWVRQDDVDDSGDCHLVGESAASVVVPGFGTGSLYTFQHTFTSSQNANSHTIRVYSRGLYSVACGGNPNYPEFTVGSVRSHGQTTITTNLTPGSYTLTVFASTTDANSRPIRINNYQCTVNRAS